MTPFSRRDFFSKNVAQFGFWGACALLFGVRKAEAGDYCSTTVEYRECVVCNHQIISCTPWTDPAFGRTPIVPTSAVNAQGPRS